MTQRVCVCVCVWAAPRNVCAATNSGKKGRQGKKKQAVLLQYQMCEHITLGHFNSLSPYAAPVFMFTRGLAAGEQLTL